MTLTPFYLSGHESMDEWIDGRVDISHAGSVHAEGYGIWAVHS